MLHEGEKVTLSKIIKLVENYQTVGVTAGVEITVQQGEDAKAAINRGRKVLDVVYNRQLKDATDDLAALKD